MTNAIEIQGLCKAYPGFLLSDINLALPEGSILGLVGENGAGKSTTIKLIMNAIAADAGSVRVLGVDNKSAAFSKVKQDVGVVLDEAYFPESLTALRLGKAMRCTYQRWDEDCYRRFLKTLSLPENKEFKDFSRGMKMKLAIAVALSHRPKLLILDEATAGLDPIVRDEMLDLFNEFTREASHSILLSSHIVSDLEKICDYIAFLHGGKLLLMEEKDRLLETYAVVRLTREEAQALPSGTVYSARPTSYGVEALAYRERLPSSVSAEHATLEEIILLLVKGDRRA